MLVNYHNEPIPLRIGQYNIQDQFVQKPGQAGDLAYAFSSVFHGNPGTPLLEGYADDRMQIRLLQGAQEEQPIINVHGHRWLAEPPSRITNGAPTP